MIKAFDVPLKSKFAGMLMITVAQVDSVWNVGIKTAAAQNMVAVNLSAASWESIFMARLVCRRSSVLTADVHLSV